MGEVSRRRETISAVAAALAGITGFFGLAVLVRTVTTVHGYSPDVAFMLLGAGAVYGVVRSRGVIRDARIAAALGLYLRRIASVRALGSEGAYRSLLEELEGERAKFGSEAPFYCLGTLGGAVVATVAVVFAVPGRLHLWVTSISWELLALPLLWLFSAGVYTLMLYLITHSFSRVFPSLPDLWIAAGLSLPFMLVVPTGTILALLGHACARVGILGAEPWAPGREGWLPRSAVLDRAASATADPLEVLRADVEQARIEKSDGEKSALAAQAVEVFLGRADPRQVENAKELIDAEMRGIALTHPERVIRLLAENRILCTPQAFDAAVGQWVRVPAGDEFDRTWERAVAVATEMAAATDGEADPYRPIGRAVAAVPPEQIPPLFRTRAAGRLFADLDASLDGAAPALESPVWELLARIAPADAPRSPGGWLCALGDAAADRAETATARSRYHSALKHGYPDALPRAAHMAAVEGHRLLRAGAPHRAVGPLREAVDSVDAPDYRLLLAMAELGSGRAAPDRETLEAAIMREYGRDPRSATVRLLAVLITLHLGDEDSALRLLRSAPQGPDAEQPERAETADLITAILSGDRQGFSAAMAAVYSRHTDAWAQQVPFDPATILAWAAHTARSASDDQRLALLFESLPGNSADGDGNGGAKDRAEAVRSIRIAAAHRMLADVSAGGGSERHRDRGGAPAQRTQDSAADTEQRLAAAESLLRGA